MIAALWPRGDQGISALDPRVVNPDRGLDGEPDELAPLPPHGAGAHKQEREEEQ